MIKKGESDLNKTKGGAKKKKTIIYLCVFIIKTTGVGYMTCFLNIAVKFANITYMTLLNISRVMIFVNTRH